MSPAPRPLTPAAPPLSPLPFTPLNNLCGSQTQTLTREKEEIKNPVQKELDDKIYELPNDPPKLENILNERFVNKKELEDEVLENIKEEYGLEEIKDAFHEASVLHQLEFFYFGINKNFIQACYFFSPNNDNREYIAFLVSGDGQNVMANNNLSVNVESGNIFHQNYNTNENFYSFFIAQQDETTVIIPKRISYHCSFEKYINKYLPSFSIDNAEKFDLFANKNYKY